jgi:archaemetzincin
MENTRAFQPQVHRHRGLILTLLPCGAVDYAALKDLARALSAKAVDVRIAARQPLPQEAFNARRQQYRAEDFLEIARNEPGDRVLALTDGDLYAGNLNYVFGLAESLGKAAVISLCRLRIGAGAEELCRRAVKEAVHELGHMLGLSHCARRSCAMFFSNSLADTDRKETNCCERCQRKLERSLESAHFPRQQGA